MSQSEIVKKHTYISQDKVISYDDSHTFLNEEEYQNEENATEDSEELAKKLTRETYKQSLSQPFENIVIFTGAGTSIGFGGKSMEELWNEIITSDYDDFIKKITYKDAIKKDLEDLLSHAERSLDFVQDEDKTTVIDKIKSLKSSIKEKCAFKGENNPPHLKFLNKLTARKIKYSRIKIFTLNYDTLFEQAAEEGKYITINGFSFSSPHYFDGTFFDFDIVVRENARTEPLDNYVDNLFHLYKPHGSIDWAVNEEKKRIIIDSNVEKPYMVYPNSNKYESSYEQPFFEMTSRFQRYIRQQNTLLICIGFSFYDKHFSNIIYEAVKSNKSLILYIVKPTIDDVSGKNPLQRFIDLAKVTRNINIVSESFSDFVDNFPYPFNYISETNRENNESI